MSAPKGNQFGVGNNGGRPTKYESHFKDLAFNYCLLGATNEQLGVFLGVSTSTIDDWIANNEEFSGAVKEGRQNADVEVVKSFYENAKGYITKAFRPIKVKKWNSEAQRLVDEVEIHEEIVEHPPNVQAGIFWLKNRQPKFWKDKREVELEGNEEKPITIINLGKGVKPKK